MGGHPYYPEDLQLPGYVPLFLTQSQIVGVYGVASVLVVTFIWFISVHTWLCSKNEQRLSEHMVKISRQYYCLLGDVPTELSPI